jgi:hypothetical protein
LATVEIESFVGDSELDDLEKAIGQYVVYRAVLAEREPDRVLYLAVPDDVVRDVFQEPLGLLLLKNHIAQVIGFDPQAEVIVSWTPQTPIARLSKPFSPNTR